MNCTCKQCGLEYEYDDETGYSEDLCGAFCHGVNSQREKIERLTLELADRVTEVGQLNVSLRDKDAKIERLRDYERELESAAEVLQKSLPIGAEKTIGLREVAAGCSELAREVERLTRDVTTNQRIAEAAALRCRNESGPCWCGCHVSEVMAATHKEKGR